MTEGKTHEPKSDGPVTIGGSGSTFQKAFEEMSIDTFMKANPNIKITYGAAAPAKAVRT